MTTKIHTTTTETLHTQPTSGCDRKTNLMKPSVIRPCVLLAALVMVSVFAPLQKTNAQDQPSAPTAEAVQTQPTQESAAAAPDATANTSEPTSDQAPKVDTAAEPTTDTSATPENSPAASPADAPADSPATVKPLVLPNGQVMFNFQNASLESVLIYFSEVAGLTIINDAKVTGRVNVFNRQPMSIEEALDVLNTVLKDRNYAAVRQGKTLRILDLDAAKKATIPVFTGNDPTKISISDKMITQVIPVRYADAAQLKRDLAPLVPAYADLSGNTSTNTLILTDTSANVRKIVEIIQALDTSLSSVTAVKVFPLQYANASSAARLITEVFKPEPAASASGQNNRIARFFQGRGGQGAGNTQNAEQGSKPETRVVASSDDRTNTVVVSAPQDMMPLITQVLTDLDANPTQDQAVFVYYMRNAQAANIETVINSIFGGSSATANQTTATNTNNRNAARTNTNNTNNRLTTASSQTASDLTGQVFAVADADTNSVLILTASSNFERVKDLLKELDRPVPQVLIKVLLAEVTHSNATDLGVEFSAINLKTSADTTVFTDFGVAAATPGGLLFKLVETDVSMAVAALQRVGKLDVLSRPYILTSDNQTANIIVGQRVPFIQNSRITDTGQTINTITYEDIGIILNVTPHINPDGLVILDVEPEISSITGDSVPISDTASAPVFATRSAKTRVAINDGKTIVIGGMMQDQKTKTVRKVPLLGDIPILGALFRRDQTTVAKTELLIFLTPHIATDPEVLDELSQEDAGRATIIRNAVAPGVFDEHIKGMKRTEPPVEGEEKPQGLKSPAEKIGPADR